MRYSCLLQSLDVSFFLPFVSIVLSEWRRTILLNFSPPMSLGFTEELLFSRHYGCVLFRFCCSGHSHLLNSYLSRIARIENPHAAPAIIRFRTPLTSPLSHFPLSSYELFASLALYRDLSVFDLWLRLRGFPVFWISMVFRHAPIPREGSGKNNNSNHRSTDDYEEMQMDEEVKRWD